MKITNTERETLQTARSKGHAFADVSIRKRTGGSYGRMCNRLVAKGLLTAAPYQLTRLGLEVLEGIDPDVPA